MASAFSPGSVGNVGVGFDILGHAIAGIGDIAHVRRIDEPVVRIAAIRGTVTDLPLQPERNTAGMALISLRQVAGVPFGFELSLEKGIPLGSGLGGSAASCVAALVAANALLDAPLAPEALYPCALAGEVVASGGIHVHHVPDLLKIYGPDAFFLFGGGTHGHPDGSRAGAAANRAAVEGVLAGKTLEQIARTSPELRKSMELWSGIKFEVTQ